MSNISAKLANRFLDLIGWQVVGPAPATPKYILIAAPHTSNWDFSLMFLAGKVLGIRISWMGKEELFRGPLGPLTRALGGVPVNRSVRQNMVAQMVQVFNERDALILAVPPAGTRRKTPYWKTGFYWIALGAQVPIAFGFIDYKRKQVGVGPTLMPTGDIEADIAVIRDFYADITAKFPEEKSIVAVRPRTPKQHTESTDKQNR
ncbi:MAG TPA: glycerol acyltransferase [Caldilineae bacterium]|nr:glycerol acyltransferase [Caldilineae bacterium]